MTCVIISVAIWLILASYFELPVSTTHSCVGGVIGMALMTSGSRCVIWNYTRDDYGNGTTNMAFENFPGSTASPRSWRVGSCRRSRPGCARRFFMAS